MSSSFPVKGPPIFEEKDGADDSNLMTRDDMSNIGLGDLEDSHTSLRPDPSITTGTNTNTTTPNPTPVQAQERI